MRKGKTKLNIYLIIIIFGFSFINALATGWFQRTAINSDRSGELKLAYWTNSENLKNKEIFNALPFKDDLIRTHFASGNNRIDSITISGRNSETTYVNIFISFKDIKTINTAPGFSNLNVTWYETADSTILLYQINRNDEFGGEVNASYTFELPTEKILRANGISSGNNIVSMGLKPDAFRNGITLFAVFTNSTGSPQSNGKSKNGNENLITEKDKKGCGVFSIELPIVIGLGLLLMKRTIRKRNQQKY